jgi:hypothetical protein
MKNGSESANTKRSFLPNWLAWIILLIVSGLAVAMVFIPAWTIQPFKPQSWSGLELSYSLRRLSPVLTLIALVIVFALVIRIWLRSRRWWRKGALIVIPILPIVSAWFAHQNHFEWMFNPLPNPQYATAGETDFVDGADMVLAVDNNGEAAAYPVRQLAYHHVVQDVVGGAPIVATY